MVAKIGFDAPKNGPSKICVTFTKLQFSPPRSNKPLFGLFQLPEPLAVHELELLLAPARVHAVEVRREGGVAVLAFAPGVLRDKLDEVLVRLVFFDLAVKQEF